jgi:hypothetical protein
MSGDSLWAPPTPDPLYLVEAYWPGVTAALVAAADVATLQAFRDQEQGTTAAYLGSLLSPTDELVLRVFRGASADLVRAANERAGIPVERVVEILALPPSGVEPNRAE